MEIIKAELLKYLFSAKVYWMTGITAILAMITTYGVLDEKLQANLPSSDTLTGYGVRYWFLLLLAGQILGVWTITSEYSSGSIDRTFFYVPNRSIVFRSKVYAALLLGLMLALFASVVGLSFAHILIQLLDQSFIVSSITYQTLAGVFLVVTLSVPFGLFVGCIIRKRVLALVLLLTFTLVVDEVLFRLVPVLGKFGLQIAQSSIYGDSRPDILSPLFALLVVCLWLALTATLAWYRFHQADQPQTKQNSQTKQDLAQAVPPLT